MDLEKFHSIYIDLEGDNFIASDLEWIHSIASDLEGDTKYSWLSERYLNS